MSKPDLSDIVRSSFVEMAVPYVYTTPTLTQGLLFHEDITSKLFVFPCLENVMLKYHSYIGLEKNCLAATPSVHT